MVPATTGSRWPFPDAVFVARDDKATRFGASSDYDAIRPRRTIFPLNELRTTCFLGGSMALLITAWVVSDNAPGTPTSVWPVVFFAGGWLYALLVPVLINLTMDLRARQFLVQEAGFHLLPAAAVIGFTTRGVAGTAYAHLANWCWWALGVAAAIALASLAYCAWRDARQRPA